MSSSSIVETFGHNFFSVTIVIFKRIFRDKQIHSRQSAATGFVSCFRGIFFRRQSYHNLGVFFAFVDVEARHVDVFAKLKFLAFKLSSKDKLVVRFFFSEFKLYIFFSVNLLKVFYNCNRETYKYFAS